MGQMWGQVSRERGTSGRGEPVYWVGLNLWMVWVKWVWGLCLGGRALGQLSRYPHLALPLPPTLPPPMPSGCLAVLHAPPGNQSGSGRCG